MKNLIFTATLLLIFSSCSNKNSTTDAVKFPPPVVKADEEVKEAPPVVASDAAATTKYLAKRTDPEADEKIDEPVGNSDVKEYVTPQSKTTVSDTSRKIVKEGDISFESRDITATRKRILNTVKKLNGYVTEDNEATDNENQRKNYSLNVQVPAKYFDLLLDTVSSTADKIDSKNISITDVTTKYIDISSRLNNKRLLEIRYQDLLKRTSKISDLLEIENKLTEIRSDIESTQGQLNYLSRQVAYSSLSITFYTRQIARSDKPVSFAYKFKRSLGKGWSFLQELFYKTISLWPLWTLVIILYITIKYRLRRRRMAEISE